MRWQPGTEVPCGLKAPGHEHEWDGYLLIRHVLLWWWFDPDRLSEAVRLRLLDPVTTIRLIACSTPGRTGWVLC